MRTCNQLIATSFFLFFCFTTSWSQNYIGAGNSSGISITSSNEQSNPNWPKQASGINTVNGEGLDAPTMEASRFLSQASIGYDWPAINDVKAMGIEGWIDDQMQKPQTNILPAIHNVYTTILDATYAAGDTVHIDEFRPRWNDFNYAWWDEMMKNDDLLRHRVAYAYSQIFVISRKSDLSNFGDALASYYDMLAKHAFGNFEDLLLDVTLHPAMGKYLSHLNNPKADPSNNVHPDENYAREIMQLFSIGLYELNLDGTRKLDSNGDFIPTYGQDDIREFAKVFTGLSVSDTVQCHPYGNGQSLCQPYGPNNLYFGKGIWTADVTKPMMMYEYQHEPGPKHLLKGMTIPGSQKGMVDIEMAIKNLVNHPNTAPFISYRLIQRLVKSNPTPSYVERVSKVFNNNGNGVKGDMAAVVKAILMDAEARACSFQLDDENSRLKEPLIKYLHFARAVDKLSPNNRNWNVNWNFSYWVNQDLMDSPSVFNFYLPDHMPNGALASNNLVGPEFNIHNTLTAPGYINQANRWVWDWGDIMSHWESSYISDNEVLFDIATYQTMAGDLETFINELDRVFTHGTLTDATRANIKNTLAQFTTNNSGSNYLPYRVRLGVYLILISPDYAVMR
jgi:uncharacterized protein (DUF1800 family)